MADVDDKAEKQAEQMAINGSDAQAARNAAAADIKAIEYLNPNKHSGSAGGNQNESIELIMPKEGGGYEVLASRTDVSGKPKEQPAKEVPPKEAQEKTHDKQAPEPITVEFLRRKAQQGDIWARSFLPDLDRAESLQSGEIRNLQVETVLKKAKLVFSSADSRRNETILPSEDQSQTDTGTIIAKQAEKNPVLAPVEAYYNWTETLEAGPERDKHKQLAKKQLVEHAPHAKVELERLDQKRKLVNEQDDSGTKGKGAEQDSRIEGRVVYLETPWQSFIDLKPAQQRDIIRVFEDAGKIGQDSYEQQIQRISKSIPKGFYNVGKSLYDTGIAAATFAVESAERPEKVPEAATKLAENLAETIASGARITQYVAAQSLEMAKTGDYSPVAAGLDYAIKKANERWDAMPLELRTEKASELVAEIGIGSMLGAAHELAKSGKLIETLETLAAHGKRNVKQSYQLLLDELFKPKGLTTNAIETPIPKETAKIEELTSKMVGRTGEYTPERKAMFLAPGNNKVLNEREMEVFGGLRRLESLSDGELASVGLRRYEMPKLHLDRDEFSIKASVPGDNKAWVHASMPQPGTVVLEHLDKGALPEGVGGHFLAQTLKAHGTYPTEKIILKKVVNKESLEGYKAGARPEDTKVARTVTRALKELGIQAKGYRYEWIPTLQRLDIIVETGR